MATLFFAYKKIVSQTAIWKTIVKSSKIKDFVILSKVIITKKLLFVNNFKYFIKKGWRFL